MVQRLALGYAFEGKDCNEAVPLTWLITVAAHPEFSTLHSHLSTLRGLEGNPPCTRHSERGIYVPPSGRSAPPEAAQDS